MTSHYANALGQLFLLEEMAVTNNRIVRDSNTGLSETEGCSELRLIEDVSGGYRRNNNVIDPKRQDVEDGALGWLPVEEQELA